MSSPDPTLWLASRSPRRRELLSQIGIGFSLLEVTVEETPGPSETAAHYNQRVAGDKALAGAARRDQQGLAPWPVLGADTEVALNNRIFGKPDGAEQACEMLSTLSGQTHQVYSSVAVVNGEGALKHCQQISQVTFADLTPRQIEAYCAAGEFQGRAGGYAIQGLGSSFVAHIDGSYSGVMGLPLFETIALLRWAGAIDKDSPLDL